MTVGKGFNESIANVFSATIFGFTAWRIYSAAALLVLYVVLRIYWAKAEQARQLEERHSVAQVNANSPMVLKREEDSNLALSDTQRIDQLHRRISLKAGEQADLKDLTFGQLSRLRVVFAGIEHASGQDFAHIKVELGGATADCGSAVQEIGENDFLVPRAGQSDQHSSIHYTCGKSDAVSFLQVKVPQFDVDEKSAAIDILHVRGRRAA